MTDMVVDCLPALFLTYRTLADSDDDVSADDRVTPWPLASGLFPSPCLLIDYASAFGLGLIPCPSRPWTMTHDTSSRCLQIGCIVNYESLKLNFV
jgi:hypothetical protein